MRCLQSALETCVEIGKIEFVVVDNGSTDATQATLSQLTSEVRSIRNDVAVDTSIAWKQALELATGDYIAFVSNDVVLQPEWHKAAVLSLAADPTCQAVSPQVVAGHANLASQPLTSTSGVCLVARTALISDATPTEAKLVAQSVVRLATAPVNV